VTCIIVAQPAAEHIDYLCHLKMEQSTRCLREHVSVERDNDDLLPAFFLEHSVPIVIRDGDSHALSLSQSVP
jgi:hypothetical protein